MRFLFLILIAPFIMGASQGNIILMLKATAKKEGIPENHLVGICGAETRWNPKATGDKRERIRSHGLCQIQTRVARDRGFKGSVKDLYNAEINAKYSAKQIRWCMERQWARDWNVSDDMVFACYNRGVGWVSKNQAKVYDLDYVKQVKKCFKPKTCRKD